MALIVVSLAQLVVVLNVAIATVAAPHVQADLGISDSARSWIMAAYLLALGGLCIVGGAIADRFGARRVFVAALIGFAVASLVAGSALSAPLFFVGVAGQGVAAAMILPSGLSKLATTYSLPHARRRALAVYGGVATSGAAIGFVLGGVMLQVAHWRVGYLAMAPLMISVAVVAWRALDADGTSRQTRVDVLASLLLTSGIAGVIVGVTLAHDSAVPAVVKVGLVLVGVGLLVAFAVLQKASVARLIPVAITRSRRKVAAMLTVAAASMVMQSTSLFVSYLQQSEQGLTPLQAGVLFLPVPITIVLVNGQVTARALRRVSPSLLLTLGLLSFAAGVAVLGGLTADTPYFPDTVTVLLLIGIGQALVLVPSLTLVMEDVPAELTGVASATHGTSVYVGGALGLAALNLVWSATERMQIDGFTGLRATSMVTIGVLIVMLVVLLAAERKTTGCPPPR